MFSSGGMKTNINGCRNRRWMCLPLSRVWVIWMGIIKSGWVLRPRIVMVLQLLTSRLCLVAICWLSDRHSTWWNFDLLMIDATEIVQVAVPPLGNSDHSFCQRSFWWQRVFQTYVVGKFSWNKSIGIQFVVLYRICSGVTFGLLTISHWGIKWASVPAGWKSCTDQCHPCAQQG